LNVVSGEKKMSTELVQLFPALRELKRAEKLYLIQFLVSELAQEETELLQSGVAYPVWSPYDAFDAASVMLKALAEAKWATMRNPERYPFIAADSALGEASLRPSLPLTLTYQDQVTTTAGLLDTGASVNVLPFRVGIELGAVWEQQTTTLQLTGNLAQYEARLLLVSATVGPFQPVRLAFAWTEAEHVPLLLGQINFFLEFNVCFHRSELAFEVTPKA
jgi:hypothetical protein